VAGTSANCVHPDGAALRLVALVRIAATRTSPPATPVGLVTVAVALLPVAVADV
jgi:hypothetical protein